jgi:hypothetical protein
LEVWQKKKGNHNKRWQLCHSEYRWTLGREPIYA